MCIYLYNFRDLYFFKIVLEKISLIFITKC